MVPIVLPLKDVFELGQAHGNSRDSLSSNQLRDPF